MSQFVTHHAHGSHPDQRTTTHGHHGSSSSSVATTPQAQAAENELFNNNPMDPAAQGVLQNARTCATAPGMDLVGGNPAPIPPAALRTVPVVAPPSDDVKAAAASGSSLSVPSSLDGKPGLGTRTASQIRMQAAGRKISAARILSNVEDWPTVRPPGIDPKRVNLPDLKAQVVVQVVDCCRSVSLSIEVAAVSEPLADLRTPRSRSLYSFSHVLSPLSRRRWISQYSQIPTYQLSSRNLVQNGPRSAGFTSTAFRGTLFRRLRSSTSTYMIFSNTYVLVTVQRANNDCSQFTPLEY